MVTILRLKRQRNALPIDEIDCESKKIKLDINENDSKASFYRFISNNVKLLPDILKRIRQSKIIKKTPKFVDVNYEDIVGKTENDQMEWEESGKETEYVYDYYCTEDLEQIKQEIVDLMSRDDYNSDDDLHIYESDEDSNDENYWGNEYLEDDDIVLRCPNYEGEDLRDFSSSDSDGSIINDYDSDCSDKNSNYDSEDSIN